MTSNEQIVPVGDAAPAQPEPTMSYAEWLTGEIKRSRWYVGDGGFLAQAMTADTLADATANDDMLSARENIGTVFTFVHATFADSDLDGQLPLFVVADVVDQSTGAKCKLSVGGARAVATLFRACQMDWFPFDASFTAVDMGSGKAALNITPAPVKVANKPK